jgi:release factor glutamine methyltransferase
MSSIITFQSMTVLEGIQKSAEFLSKKGVDSPRLQAELLLAHVLKLPRMKLYLNFERGLSEAETGVLREFVKRRSQREPLQHIIGFTLFCGLEIMVNRHVLVPRPETEILAEFGWKWLKELSQASTPGVPILTEKPHDIGDSQGSSLRVLDFGTGSGCIAIALAAKDPASKIVALDVSAKALETAKENAVRNNVEDRIEFVQGDGFTALASEGRTLRVPGQNTQNGDSRSWSLRQASFDLIISNPPYISTGEIETLEPEVRDFDPRRALDGGLDGLDFYRRFAAEARPFLKSEGKIMLEFGDGQADSVRKIFETQNWIVEAVRADYTERQRILIAKLNH